VEWLARKRALQRAAFLLQHPAHGVIDCRDVIRVMLMAQAEQAGYQRKPIAPNIDCETQMCPQPMT
jgi:hypothetical protein